MRTRKTGLVILGALCGGFLLGQAFDRTLIPIAAANAATPTGPTAAEDREAILTHLKSIFQAFVDRDRDAIERPHTEDWTGFRGYSQSILRGREQYMAAVDRGQKFSRGTGYELLDTEVQVYGDVAIVYYLADYNRVLANGEAGTTTLRTVDIYRRDPGGWNQAGSGVTILTPPPTPPVANTDNP